MTTLQNSPLYFQEPRELFSDLASLRQDHQIHFSPALEAYVLTRYDEIVTVLDHPEIFSSAPTVPDTAASILDQIGPKCPMRGTLLGHDNPDHDRLRECVNTFFMPRKLQRFEPLIEKLAEELLDEISPKGNANIKFEFALPMPLKVVSTIVGLDASDWKWVARSLSLFGGHPELTVSSIEEKVQGIIEIHDHIAELIKLRRTDRRDDLISHIWNERDAGNIMSDFEHLSMIPGLLLAGYETTTNLLSMGLSHLLHNNLWDAVSVDDSARAAAIEELLRYESAITGMRRVALQPFTVGSSQFKPGDQLFLAYNAGSRDPKYFDNPDKVNPRRKGTMQHLGFGLGIHACLGAPLARLLLRVELRFLYERLPGLRLVTDYDKVHYEHVHEVRGIKEMRVAWDATAAAIVIKNRALSAARFQTKLPMNTRTDLLITEATIIARDVLELTMRALPGKTLPRWDPGAHIDIPVGPLGWRQYSLCSDRLNTDLWQVAVLLEKEGCGGSEHIHAAAATISGQTVTIGGPRNHFALRPAARYLFIAGGIGVTPIRSMWLAARKQGTPYKVVYLGASMASMAYAQELRSDANVLVWPKDERGPFSLEMLAHEENNRDESDSLSLNVYCCGPPRLVSGVEEVFAHLPEGSVHIEHFAAAVSDGEKKEFEVVLKQSRRQLHVPKDRSLLEVLNDSGVGIVSTCTKGTCGTCEVPVLGGRVEHRDTVLTAPEKAEGRSMMACVSRCMEKRLVLDLW